MADASPVARKAVVAAIAFVTSVGVVLSAQNPSGVVSVSARLVRKPVPIPFVVLKNLRESPLVEWSITMGSSTTTHSEPPPSFKSDAILPGAEQRIRSWSSTGSATAARVRIVAFADGFIDGEPAAVNEFLAAQARKHADLLWWKGVLAATPRTSVSDAIAYLRDCATANRQKSEEDPTGTRSHVLDFVRDPAMRAFMLFGRLEQLRDDIDGSMTNADRYRIWHDSHPSSAVGVVVPKPSFQVRSETGQGTELAVEIENLRDLPLEAWEFDVAAPDGRTGRGESTDAGATLLETERSGAIKPHGSREILMGSEADVSNAVAAQVTMRFALWSDLSWEGEKGSVDRLFAERDRRADTYAYWIAAFKDAMAMEPADAVKYLERRQDERIRAMPDESRFLLSTYPNWKSLSSTDPDRMIQTIDRHRAILEQQYALLTRHHPSR